MLVGKSWIECRSAKTPFVSLFVVAEIDPVLYLTVVIVTGTKGDYNPKFGGSHWCRGGQNTCFSDISLKGFIPLGYSTWM